MESDDDDDEALENFEVKVIVIGDQRAGKTSLIRRYVGNEWSPNYRGTIGVDFTVKRIRFEDSKLVTLHLWDIAGQETTKKVSRPFYRSAAACIVVCDVMETKSLQSALGWKEDLDGKYRPDGMTIPSILFANKCDLLEADAYDQQEQVLKGFCEDNGFLSWFFTSAKENINIDQGLRFLIAEIFKRLDRLEVRHETREEAPKPPAVDIRAARAEAPPSGGGCC